MTDPAFELVAEFTELKRKHRSLASDVVGAERRLEKLNNQIREQEQKLKKEKARTRDARRDALKAKQDLEGVLKANPEAGYEYFSSDDRIRKLKPER